MLTPGNPGSPAEPLTVVLTLLSRPDPTPLNERCKAPGNMLDHAGMPIDDPAAAPHDNAFESDPNLIFEKWTEYWRKVHGTRFVFAEGDDDIGRLLRYDQMHRVSAGPTNMVPPPYRAPLDATGRMYSTVVGHVPPYRRPRWDGAAYLCFSGVDDVRAVFSSQRVQEKILPEERVMFRDLAPFLSRRHVVLASESGRDPVSLLVTHVRRPGTVREAFQAEWLGEHARLVLAQPDVPRLVRQYVQLHNVGDPTEGAPFYHPDTSGIDGITLLSFANMNDVEEFLVTPSFDAIRRDERRFSDIDQGEFWTTLNFTVADRIGQGTATGRAADVT